MVAETRYLPYGEERWTAGGTQPTDFTFTGQRVERGFGLMDYQARYYDPRLGRFVTPDSIVPNPGNSQDLNRYSYVANNPVKFTDPAGYRYECGSYIGECSSDTYYNGFSVLDDRPEVQAYLKESMAPKHYLEPIAIVLGAGGAGVVVEDVLTLAPAAAPYVYYLADKIYKFGQTFWGKRGGDALEGAAEGCLEADCSPESVVAGAVEGAALGALDSVSRKIARGHAYDKHVIKRAEFPEISSPDEFEHLVHDVMNNYDATKSLSEGRQAYWKDDVVVITNPADPDGGTAFRPIDGKEYYDNLK